MPDYSNPCVTIGLPVYNGSDYLTEAIESILGQTYTNFELIISDNASTDETAHICEQYARRDSRIKYYRSEINQGAAWNYNHLVERARGKYFKWAAHDDLCMPEFLENCVRILDQIPEVVVCYPRSFVIDGSGEIICSYSDDLHIRDASPSRRLRQYMRTNFLRKRGMCNPVFGLIRRSALQQTTLIQPFVASDRSLLAQIAVLGEFYELSQELFKRRVHNNDSTYAHRDLKSRQAWFDASGIIRSQMSRKLRSNYFTVRYRQVKDIVRALSNFDIDPRSKRACYIELIRLFAGDPKWIYIDLKYSLGFLPSRAKIVNDLKNSQ